MKISPRTLEELAKFQAAIDTAQHALITIRADLPRDSEAYALVDKMTDTLYAEDNEAFSADRIIQAIVAAKK